MTALVSTIDDSSQLMKLQ